MPLFKKDNPAPKLPAAPPPAPPPPPTLEQRLAEVAILEGAGLPLRPYCEDLVRKNFALEGHIAQLRELQQKLKENIEALCSPEQFPAVITEVHCNGKKSVEVFGANMLLEVAVSPEIPADRLRVGARGVLAKARNCLIEVDGASPRWNEVGTFEGYTTDGKRLLLKHQEQLVAASPSEELAKLKLKKGDLIGFDRDGPKLAYVRLEPPGKEDLFFEDTPSDRFEELGGLDREIALLKRIIRFRMQHPELARRYKLASKRGILLEGPPGNGKTKLARCLARFIAKLAPAGQCRFMAISGSADYSMWLGQSEQRVIARFEAARQLAGDEGVPVLMFFDEIDALGRSRGTDFGSGAPDRILSTFLSQLDGVQQVANLVVVAATNRADILDRGLVRPGRLGDVRIRIPAPNRTAARAILTRYLDGLPLDGPADAVVEGLLSRVYSPKGEYAELARVTFRDGRKLPIGGKDLLSGAMLENMVKVAAEEAADREAQTGAAGLTEADLLAALDKELRSSATLLTPRNIAGSIPRLPQEVDAVAIEFLGRGPGPSLYVRSA